MRGAAVEVRKNKTSTTWYCASILDIVGDHIRVGFEDGIWPSRDVPADSVRQCPQEHASDGFDPQVDEVVEVSVSASESNPSGWSLGRVKTIKNSFYFIGFVGTHKGSQDLIVEGSALRRVNAEPPVDASKLVRRLVAVSPELHAWIGSQDFLGCLRHVQAKGRLLVASCSEQVPPEVLLIGSERSALLGEKLLVQIHFRHQAEMRRFHETREQLIERLAERKKWYSAQHKEVFSVDQALVGKVIGKKGENINLIREKFSVDIHLQDADDGEARMAATVTITGLDADSVKKAREAVEYVTERLPVQSEQVGWILGRGFQNIQDMAKKTELHYARYDDKSMSLELCGLRQQVEDAKMLISVHLEYLPVYQDMDEEQHAIQQSFEELGSAGPRKGEKGKGRGGKDSWRGYPESSGGRGGRGRGGSGKGEGHGASHTEEWNRSAGEDYYPPLGSGSGKRGTGKGRRKGGK
mmetsp:Transcript_61635/g.133454  ORF Transcript_61635/g.133454 Transcript_61635/m.133454 type:complete len:467 (-) Transcript_61635:54-1454(-)